ncbi:MAG: hypothetical protein GX969_07045, partial [Firmicutes bacterium]|nr:hypothetical protein [Bacillota bacterium]
LDLDLEQYDEKIAQFALSAPATENDSTDDKSSRVAELKKLFAEVKRVRNEEAIVLNLTQYRQYFAPYTQASDKIMYIIHNCFEGITCLVGITYDTSDPWFTPCTEIIVLEQHRGGYKLRYKENVAHNFNIHPRFHDDYKTCNAFAVNTEDKLLIKTEEPYPSDYHVGRYIFLDKDKILYTSEYKGDSNVLIKYKNGELLAYFHEIHPMYRAGSWKKIVFTDEKFEFLPLDTKPYLPNLSNNDFVIEVLHFEDYTVEGWSPHLEPILSGKLDFQIKLKGTTINKDCFKYSHSYDPGGDSIAQVTKVYTYKVDLDTCGVQKIVLVNKNNCKYWVVLPREEKDVTFHPGWIEWVNKEGSCSIVFKTLYGDYEIVINS